MAATVLTIEAARAANIDVVENGKYTQAVHEVVVAIQAARRSGTASTKTRGEVRGSGTKPWRQKGTGRARAGSKRSPVWVGGGVVFGPKPRDYSKKVPKQIQRIALRKAFSERIKDGDVLIVPTFGVEAPKTKEFLALLGAISPDPKTLIISRVFDSATSLAARNAKPARLVSSTTVNTEELLAYRKIVVTPEALSDLAARMLKR